MEPGAVENTLTLFYPKPQQDPGEQVGRRPQRGEVASPSSHSKFIGEARHS